VEQGRRLKRYVAKKTKDYMKVRNRKQINRSKGSTLRAIKASAIACEIPTPSRCEVPLPSSSTSISDLKVARPGQFVKLVLSMSWVISSKNLVSLQTKPSRLQKCSDSFPCHHHLINALGVRRVSYSFTVYRKSRSENVPEARILRWYEAAAHGHQNQ